MMAHLSAANCRRFLYSLCSMRQTLRRQRSGHRRELALAYLGALSAADVYLDRIIDEHIARVLAATDENLSTAAELLGMHRRSLQRYVRRKAARARKRAGARKQRKPRR